MKTALECARLLTLDGMNAFQPVSLLIRTNFERTLEMVAIVRYVRLSLSVSEIALSARDASCIASTACHSESSILRVLRSRNAFRAGRVNCV